MPSRRQYSSCDQCRRSKRKCTTTHEGIARGPGLVCRNCSRLGYKCTFAYVSARTEQKRKERFSKTFNQNALVGSRKSISHPGSVSQGDEMHWTTVNDSYNVVSPETSQTAFDSIFAELTTLDSLGEDWTFDAAETSGSLERPVQIKSPKLSHAVSASKCEYRTHMNETRLSGFWVGSPIQLLNSTFTQNVLGSYLHHTYASMMHGMESRYLDYACNAFAPSYKYSFAGEHLSHSSIEPIQLPNPVDYETNEQPMTVTFVGLARFLDHFGHFYGNKLDRHSKKEDEALLVAVQQAFALQWSVLDEFEKGFTCQKVTNENKSPEEKFNIFTTAWYNARSRILNAGPNRSFTRVYAMLLFHTCVAPDQAKDAPMERESILHQCLHQLLDLKAMVEEYSQDLSATSTYRRLMESSVKVFQWFAYVKDTFASLLGNRDCILVDNLPSFKDAPFNISSQVIQSTDIEIPSLCQRAASYIGRFLRHVARVKHLVREEQYKTDPSSFLGALDVSMNLVDDFNLMYGRFHDECISSHFAVLSDVSRLSFGYQILFWNLGVLTLVEQIQTITQNSEHSSSIIPYNISNKAREYETAAILSVVAISKHISKISTEEGHIKVADHSEIKLPFISHHASLDPIVAVLCKTVEHVIQPIACTDIQMLETNPDTTDSLRSQMLSIKPLLACLLDMNATVAGSRSTRSALRKLMKSHGDILMDCWAVDEMESFDK